MDLTLIISAGILLGCFLGLSWFAGSDAPFVPTQMLHIRKVLKLAGVKRGKKFYELGSGDGRVVLEAAKLGADSIGIEQSLLRVLYSRFRTKTSNGHSNGHPKGVNIEFWHNNIFNRSFKDADIVYIYLLPQGIEKLEDKLKKELKKGTVVITQTFHFTSWKPFKKMDFPKEKVYQKDIKGAGNFWLYKV